MIDRQLVPEQIRLQVNLRVCAMGKRETGVIPVRSRHCDKGVQRRQLLKRAVFVCH